MNRRRYAVIGVLAVLMIGIAGYAATTVLGGTPTGQIVQDTLSLSAGGEFEVLEVEDRGSVHRVLLKPRDGTNTRTVYVTEDGRYIVQNLVSVANFTRSLQARDEFISCLEENDAELYGVVSQNQQLAQQVQLTQLQLQALGRLNGVENIFQGIGAQGSEARQRVLAQGVAWRIGGEFVQGNTNNGALMTIQELEDETGCTYDVQAQEGVVPAQGY